MFERVVVGVTGSDSGQSAVQRAMDVAKSAGGTLHLVAAIAPHRPGPPDMPEEFRDGIGSVDPADWLLQRLAAEAKGSDIEAKAHAVLDGPVGAIMRVAAEENADLIVVGSSHARKLRLGAGVADALMARAECAVLVV
jgi:nucleotide-binding universal stress UspA family protein